MVKNNPYWRKNMEKSGKNREKWRKMKEKWRKNGGKSSLKELKKN